MLLADQTAVITGAASGIGRAVALRFAEEGARVVLADLQAEPAGQVAAEIEARGGQALAVETNVAEADSVARLFAAVDQQGWPVDMLVNNAGIAEPQLQATPEVSDELWHRILRVHLDGTFFCTREALRRMLPRKTGSIVNLGSVAGLNGLPGAPAYSAAKGGIISLTKSLSQEAAPQGVRVNCVAPGWTNTPMLDNMPAKWRPGMLKHTPLGRLGEPGEVAAVILYLAGPQSSFVTGQVLSPNGGMFRW